MAVQTGRTASKYMDFIVDDSGGTLRSIPVSSVTIAGVTYTAVDVTAIQDAIANMVLGRGAVSISIAGPWDTLVAAAAGTLSGSHTILSGIVGGATPLTIDVQQGIRHAWEAGEPQFGLTSSATSGFLCNDYQVPFGDEDVTYTAEFVLFGPTAPAWGTAAET